MDGLLILGFLVGVGVGFVVGGMVVAASTSNPPQTMFQQDMERERKERSRRPLHPTLVKMAHAHAEDDDVPAIDIWKRNYHNLTPQHFISAMRDAAERDEKWLGSPIDEQLEISWSMFLHKTYIDSRKDYIYS